MMHLLIFLREKYYEKSGRCSTLKPIRLYIYIYIYQLTVIAKLILSIYDERRAKLSIIASEEMCG